MQEQSSVIDLALEQTRGQEQQAEREQLAIALYQSFINGEGQSTTPLEGVQILSDEDKAVHQELLGQLNSVNGTVPERFQQKRDYSKSAWLQRSDERDKIEVVKQAVSERLAASDIANKDKAERDAHRNRVEEHTKQIELRDTEAADRQAVRDAYINRQKLLRGPKQLELFRSEIEAEAEAHVAETLGEAKYADYGAVDTGKLKRDRDEVTNKTPETSKNGIDELRVEDSDVPEFHPDNLKEQPIDWADSDFVGWEEDSAEFFAGDDEQPTATMRRYERPVDAAVREFTENSRKRREHDSPRKRIRQLMERAHDLLTTAHDWSSLKLLKGYDKLQDYFGDADKGDSRRLRAAVAGVVIGPLATYGATRLGMDLFGGTSKSTSTTEASSSLLAFLPFGGSGAKEQLFGHAAHAHEAGRHAVAHAVRVGNEVTLKSGVHGGDSIWREEYNQAHHLHPAWSEHHLNNWADAHTRHLMEVNNLTEAEAEKLKAGATIKS